MNRYQTIRRSIRKILLESIIDEDSVEKISELLKSENEALGRRAVPGSFSSQGLELIRAFGEDPLEFANSSQDPYIFRAILRYYLLEIFPNARCVSMNPSPRDPEYGDRVEVDFDYKNPIQSGFQVDFSLARGTMEVKCYQYLRKSHWKAFRREDGSLIRSESQTAWPILNTEHPKYPCPIDKVPLDLAEIIDCAEKFADLMGQNLKPIEDPSRTMDAQYY